MSRSPIEGVKSMGTGESYPFAASSPTIEDLSLSFTFSARIGTLKLLEPLVTPFVCSTLLGRLGSGLGCRDV